MFKNRLTLGYVLLVGVPLLFLVATLRAGGSLAAPPSVGGEWLIETASSENTCLAPLVSSRQPALTVYQSGTELSIVANDARRVTFTGELKDRNITGTALYKDDAARCGREMLIHLNATLVGRPGKGALQGQFLVNDCDSCPPVSFRATKPAVPGK